MISQDFFYLLQQNLEEYKTSNEVILSLCYCSYRKRSVTVKAKVVAAGRKYLIFN